MAAAIGMLLVAAGSSFGQSAQSAPDLGYSRVYAFGAMAEYSNDSSHIFLGSAPNRKIGAVGFEYQRRLLHARAVDFSYAAEARPAILVSNPTALETFFTGDGQAEYSYAPTEVVRCVRGTYQESPGNPQDGTIAIACGRRATYTEGLSPFGFQLNFAPKHRLQAVFTNHEGYMFSTRPVPIQQSGAFNFTFEFGAGFEWYLSHRRSVRVEYALQHFSNKDSAGQNPGVDSGFVKIVWSFGR
jgi:opacity protein-like surface antigen